jgi:hypothetical protein
MSDLFYEEDLAFHRARVAAHQEVTVFVYKKVRDGNGWMFTVGFYEPPTQPDHNGCSRWMPLHDYIHEGEAQMMVRYLNGGTLWGSKHDET